MAKIHIDFKSEILDKNMKISVIAPIENKNMMEEASVLLLLHGLGNSEYEFINKANIEEVAIEHNLIIITPFCERGFYCNLVTGVNYFDYTKFEVIKTVQSCLNINIEDKTRYIMGVSMGGYGAFKLGLDDLNSYAGIGSISGSVDIIKRDGEKRTGDKDIALEWVEMFGEKIDDSNDLFKYLNKDINTAIYMCCGNDDFLKSYNDKFHDKLLELDIQHMYSEGTGEHTWTYFAPHIREGIKYLIGRENAK